MSKTICFIFNYAPHYREPIYSLIDKHFNSVFYFGDKVETPIKKLDYDKFKNPIFEVKNQKILGSSYIYQFGVFKPLLKNHKYYVIHALPNYLSNWIILCWAKLFGKKVFVWGHGLKGNPNRHGRWKEKLFYKLSSDILLYGHLSKENFKQLGYDSDKLHVIYNSLNYDEHLKIRNQTKKTDIFKDYFNNDDPTIIYVGRIQKVKKLGMLIEGIQHLKEKNINANLVIVGKDVNDQDNLEKLIKKHNLSSKVWFYGPCYDEVLLAELFYNASLCVSPGPIGLTAIHSLSFGTPIVTNDDFDTQMPEFEAIIEGVTGSFFKNGSVIEMVEKMEPWLLGNIEHREKVRTNAFKVIDEKYNPHIQIKILNSVIDKYESTVGS